MNKYTYSILGLCILSLVFLGVVLNKNTEQVDSEDNQPVDLSIDYTNGTHMGYINSFKSESGRTYLSIDFLQAFVTKKGAFVASIEENFCPLETMQQHIRETYPDELEKKKIKEVLALQNTMEAAVFFSKMPSQEVEDIAQYSGCFPNGINYTRNKSIVERERIVSPSFVSTLEGETVTYENIIPFLTRKKSENSEHLTYMITLKNSIVTKLDTVQK